MRQTTVTDLSTYQRYIVLLIAILLLSIGQFTTDIYLPSVPTIVDWFHTSNTSVQLTITLYYIGYGLSQFFYGPLSDNYGRRPVILASLSIYLLGTIICLFSHSIEILLLGRFVQGVGIGGAATIAAAIPHDIFTGSKIGQAFSYIGIAIAITPLIAPILGGYFQTYFGWQSNFIFLLTYAGLFIFILSLYFPETNLHASKAPIKPMVVLKNYLSIIANKIFILSLLALILTLLGEILYIVWLPIILQNYFKMSPLANGWIMIFPATGLAVGGVISSLLCKYKNKNTAMVCGFAIIVISSVVFVLLNSLFGLSKGLIIATMSIYMIGSGISFPIYIGICTGCYPKNAGTAGALMSGVLTAGAGLWGAFLLKTSLVQYDILAHTQGMLCIILAVVGLYLLYSLTVGNDEQ